MLLLITLTLSIGNIQISAKMQEEYIFEEVPSTSAYPINLAAWIIIAGDRDDHEHINLIKQGCDEVHEALVNRGFHPDDICYLGPIEGGFTPYQDYYSLLSNVEWAIEEWAPTKGVSASQGLGLYIFDHGGVNGFCLPGTDLSDTTLNTYLDNLEADTGCNRMVIIYEACHAGSFINPLSKHNRIIVTSTDTNNNAHGDAVGGWAVFSVAFWSNLVMCRTIGEAFVAGRNHVIGYGYGGVQFPWIDDNHDEIGHEAGPMGSLPNGGDGSDALNVWIGTGENCPAISIQFYPVPMFLSYLTPVKPFWVVVDSTALIDGVYARIVPPNWTPAEGVSDDEGTKLVEDLGVLVYELYDYDRDGNYTGFIEVGAYPDFWALQGDYKMTFHARSQDGIYANIKSTNVTLNEDGLPPPDTTLPTIDITSPNPDAELTGSVNITAVGDDNQALDRIQLYIDGELVEEELMPPYFPYPEVTHVLTTDQHSLGFHTISATAIDKANNTQSTSIRVKFYSESITTLIISVIIFGLIIGVVIIIIWKIRKRS